MVDTESGEFTDKTIAHEGKAVREFCAALKGPVFVGIEATGAMQWFLELLEELGIGLGLTQPAKQHRHELSPATQSARVTLGLILAYQRLELHARN